MTNKIGKKIENKTRNIGIIAHVDAGKTTTAERILYYTGENHRIGDTHKGDTSMDFEAQEKAKGITINSAATKVFWRDYPINIIDTSGHIDFNIEVKRSLRVLDGAVVVFDGVAGVEPQTEANWGLADQYCVPRIALINKLDRTGANFLRVVEMIRMRLGVVPLVLYLPVDSEGSFNSVIDLLHERVLYWPNSEGVAYEVRSIPADMNELVQLWREKLVELAVEQDEHVLQRWLDGEQPTADELQACIRKGTIAGAFVPVLAASAYRNYGIEPVLDAVVDYLPAPDEVESSVPSDPNAPLVALLFKVVASQHGQLSFLRIYRGCLHAGDTVLNATTGKRERVSRLYEMHASQRIEVDLAQAGDIVAVVGLKDAMTGHTLTDPAYAVILEEIVAPDSVIDIAIEPKTQADQQRLGVALQTLVREDPSLHARQDPDSGQIILSGMGELQLEVRLEDLRARFNVEVKTGKPQVAYRETVLRAVKERYLHKKQSGGPGQYAEVEIMLEPLLQGEGIQFESKIIGGAVPREYIPGIEAGIRRAMQAGVLGGFACVDMKVTLLDGSYHEQDSSITAFEQAGAQAFYAAMRKATPVLLEPVMCVQVYTPAQMLGSCMGDLSRRRGLIRAQEVQGGHQINSPDSENTRVSVIEASVPLQEMFGYIATLRTLTSGRGSFNMQFECYAQTPQSIAKEVLNLLQNAV